MTREYILALDLGTTGNRAIVFDREQNIVSQAYQEFPQIYPKPGWVEHDAELIWRSVRAILEKTFKKIPAQKIAAIGVTNQRETVVLWDKKTGKPAHHAIVWQDRRTADLCAALKKRGLEKAIRRSTGLFLDPYFSATKLAWLLENVQGVRARAGRGELLAGTIDSWIIWKLSGGRSHVTDPSNASRTMLFNIQSLRWDDKLCRVFGVPRIILPQIRDSSGVSAFTDEKITGTKLPVAGIVGDQQAASFAQGCFSPGVIKNTYGTGLFALENTGPRPRFSKNLLTTVAWRIGGKTDYAVEGSVFIAGAAVQWLREGLQIIKKASETEKMAGSLVSNDGVYFVPALVGLGAPYWDAHARGTILGLTRGTTRRHLARAALEAVAYQTRDILEVMKRDAGQGFRRLRADGGAAANDFLMQFQADILGIPVERPKILETTALGAAGLAGLAAGVWKSREEFNRLRKVDKVFYPTMTEKERDQLYGKWKEAVKRSLRWA